jgi:hypothetical protein
MKLPCPYCTENIVYDHNLAGKTIKCSYCQNNILMTPFDKLPPDYQQEYKDELEKIRKKQEAEQKKVEEQKRKELERQEANKRREIDKAFEQARKEEEKTQQQEKQQDWNRKVSQVKQIVPEEEIIESKIFGIVVTQSYPILKLFASLYRIVGVICLLLGLITIIVALYSATQSGLGIFFSWMSIALGFLLGSIPILAIAEMIYLVVNIADDLRISKALLKHIAYFNKEPNPPPNS